MSSPPGPPGPLVPPSGYGQPSPYNPPYVVPDASGATPAMVLGIVSLCLLPLGCCCGIGGLASLILGILAVVFGITARNRIGASGGALGGRGKATAGIVTGGVAVGIAVVVILLVLLVGISSSTLGNYINSFPSPSPSG